MVGTRFETGLSPLVLNTNHIKFVDGDNQLLYAKTSRQEGMFLGLSIGIKTGFKPACRSVYNQNCDISLIKDSISVPSFSALPYKRNSNTPVPHRKSCWG